MTFYIDRGVHYIIAGGILYVAGVLFLMWVADYINEWKRVK